MVAYQDFVALSQSEDSEERGQAAHLAALAYLNHYGPADEHAALYAALIAFLDDPSVKVRAALAYGLLHAREAPRPILLALLHDSPVIAHAVAQYSPALIEADLIALIREAPPGILLALAMRERLSTRVAEAMIDRADRNVTLKLLHRRDVALGGAILASLSAGLGVDDAAIRGALLGRRDLPPHARLCLVEAAAKAMRTARIVCGAIAPARLDRLLRDATDGAVTEIGERQAAVAECGYAAALITGNRLSTRVLLHAIVNGHVLFFAQCVSELSGTPGEKVFTLLETGSRVSLNALLARCGLSEAVRNLVVRLIFHARAADLADDVAARHFVVTAVTEELVVEHAGAIPVELEEAFIYLSAQNVLLARMAARGVMASFAGRAEPERPMLLPGGEERLALPAA